MKPLLSVLIPSVSIRSFLLNRLLSELETQVIENNYEDLVEILVYNDSMELSVGHKGNVLIEKSKGKYIVGIGDDDMIEKNYLKKIITTIQKNPDVDQITFDMCLHNLLNNKKYILKFSKENKIQTLHAFKPLKIKIDINPKMEKKVFLYIKNFKLPTPNIINIMLLVLLDLFRLIKKSEFYTWPTMVLKKEIIKKIKFSDKKIEQDLEWASKIKNMDLIKTEILLNEVLYFYNYNRKKSINRNKDFFKFENKNPEKFNNEFKIKIKYL